MGELKYMERQKWIRIINPCKIAWNALRKEVLLLLLFFCLKCFKGACAMGYIENSFLLTKNFLFLKHLKEISQWPTKLLLRVPSSQDECLDLDRAPVSPPWDSSPDLWAECLSRGIKQYFSLGHRVLGWKGTLRITWPKLSSQKHSLD